MKRLLLFLILPLFAVAEEFDLPDGLEADPKRPYSNHRISAYRKFIKEKSAIQVNYRNRLAEALKYADGAEVLLLSFTPVKKVPDGEEEKYFPILPYGSHHKILDRKRLNGEKLIQRVRLYLSHVHVRPPVGVGYARTLIRN